MYLLYVGLDNSGQINKTHNVNRRIVKHFLSNGQGFSDLEKFYIVMNMKQGMRNSTFSKHSKYFSKSAAKKGQLLIEKARERGKQVHGELDKSKPVSKNTVLDLSVPFDGTWHRRGYTSLNDVVDCIIEL